MNKLDKIEQLSLKLNRMILNEPVVQEYKKYEQLIKNNEKLIQQEKRIKQLQKKIVQQKANQDDTVEQTIQQYQKEKKEFENHPLLVNYLYLKEEVDCLLQTVNNQINSQLK
ncbi:MAG: YlbF family regulator [Faecalibacillus sp.]